MFAKYVVICISVIAAVLGAVKYPLVVVTICSFTFMAGAVIAFKPKTGGMLRRLFFYSALLIAGFIITIFAVQAMSFKVGIFVFVSTTTWASALMILSGTLTAMICANETKIEHIRTRAGSARP